MISKRLKRTRRGLKAKAIQKRLDVLRLVIFRSANHIYCQIVEVDEKNQGSDRVLAAASTIDKELRADLKGSKTEKAQQVGKLLAERAKAKKIDKVAFDRSGYKYHGRVKALAEGARQAGLIF